MLINAPWAQIKHFAAAFFRTGINPIGACRAIYRTGIYARQTMPALAIITSMTWITFSVATLVAAILYSLKKM